MHPDARRRAILAALSVLPILGPRAASAQGDKWPARPIKVLCGFPPGGGADAMARLIGLRLGLAGPAKLPPAIVERLDREVRVALGQPAAVKRLGELDAEVAAQGTPAQFAQFWKEQIVKYRKIIADARIEAA